MSSVLCPGRQGPAPFPPWSLELGGPGGHRSGAMDQVGWQERGGCETRGLGLGLEGHPYLPCPASPGPQVTEATGAVCRPACLHPPVTPSPTSQPVLVQWLCRGHPQMALSAHRGPPWPSCWCPATACPSARGESRRSSVSLWSHTVAGAAPCLSPRGHHRVNVEGRELGQGSFEPGQLRLCGSRALDLSLGRASLRDPPSSPSMNRVPWRHKVGLELHSRGPVDSPGPRGRGSRPLPGQTCGTGGGLSDKWHLG